MKLLSDIRPHERSGALAAFFTVGGIMAGHELLETGRDALFLARVPATQLPWVYLAIAALGVIVSKAAFGRLAVAFGARTLSVTLLIASVISPPRSHV